MTKSTAKSKPYGGSEVHSDFFDELARSTLTMGHNIAGSFLLLLFENCRSSCLGCVATVMQSPLSKTFTHEKTSDLLAIFCCVNNRTGTPHQSGVGSVLNVGRSLGYFVKDIVSVFVFL